MKHILKYSGIILVGLAVIDVLLILFHLSNQVVYDVVMYTYPLAVLIILNRRWRMRKNVNFQKLAAINASSIILVSLLIGFILASLSVINFSSSEFFKVGDMGYGVTIGITSFASSLIWLIIDMIVALLFNSVTPRFFRK